MSKHTPGPWEIHAGNEVWSENDRKICVTSRYFDDGHDADIRLIAAAPDLLAACKLLLERMRVNELGTSKDPMRGTVASPWRYDSAAVEAGIAAIAKAEGAGGSGSGRGR